MNFYMKSVKLHWTRVLKGNLDADHRSTEIYIPYWGWKLLNYWKLHSLLPIGKNNRYRLIIFSLKLNKSKSKKIVSLYIIIIKSDRFFLMRFTLKFKVFWRHSKCILKSQKAAYTGSFRSAKKCILEECIRFIFAGKEQ